MAQSISYGYTDTAISGVTSLTLPRGLINFKSDFSVQKNATTDITLVNLTSPVDRPEKFRFALSNVDNIYANTGIDPSVWGATKQGQSLLIQLTEVLSVTDSVDPSYRVDLPVQCNISLKVPKNSLVTPEYLLTLIGRAVSGAFGTGETSTNGIKRLIHGSLIPADL